MCFLNIALIKGDDTILAAERREKIVEIIRQTGMAKVEELSNSFDVSLMTIRRDLQQLTEEGMIERCHGGAIIKKETSYGEKKTQQLEEKIKIAQKCAQLVKKGDTVFLDAGTTIYEIAKLIKDIQDITIITNDLETARLLIETDVNLMICGGDIQKSTGSVTGRFTNQMMEDIRTEIAFLGTMCIDDDYNVLTPTSEKVDLKRIICRNTNNPYLAVDKTKFGKQAIMRINNLSNYKGVVTNKVFTEEEKKKIKKMKINIIQA